MNFIHTILQQLKKHSLWVKWLAAIAILYYLYSRNEQTFHELKDSTISWSHLLTAVGLFLGSLLLTFYRWYLLVWAQDMPFKIRDAFRLGFIGYMFNYVAPGAVGGDFVKAALIAREQPARRGIAAATVILDRILGLLGLLVVGTCVSFVPTNIVQIPKFHQLNLAYYVGTIAGLSGLMMMMIPAVPRWRLVQRMVALPVVGRLIGGLMNAVLMYQARWRVIFVAVLVSIVGHFGMLSSFFYCGLALNGAENIPGYVEHLQFIPAAELFSVMIPLPGGTGPLEGAINYFYNLSGAAEGSGLITALVYRSISILTAMLGGGYYMLARKEIDKVVQEELQEKPE